MLHLVCTSYQLPVCWVRLFKLGGDGCTCLRLASFFCFGLAGKGVVIRRVLPKKWTEKYIDWTKVQNWFFWFAHFSFSREKLMIKRFFLLISKLNWKLAAKKKSVCRWNVLCTLYLFLFYFLYFVSPFRLHLCEGQAWKKIVRLFLSLVSWTCLVQNFSSSFLFSHCLYIGNFVQKAFSFEPINWWTWTDIKKLFFYPLSFYTDGCCCRLAVIFAWCCI